MSLEDINTTVGAYCQEMMGRYRDLLREIHKCGEDTVLANLVETRLTELDQEVGNFFGQHRVTYDSLLMLSDSDILKVLGAVDMLTLVKAYKGEDHLRHCLLRNMGKKNRDQYVRLEDELGPISGAEQGKARSEVIGILRTLEKQGKIRFGRTDMEDFK